MVFNNSLKIHSPTSDRWHQVVRTQGQSRTHPSMKSATSNQQLLIFHLIRNQIKHKKSSIIPPPSYCTRLSHLDETQNAKQEPANPHDSTPSDSDARSHRKSAVPKAKAARRAKTVVRCPGSTKCTKTFDIKTDAVRHWRTSCIYNPNRPKIQCPVCVEVGSTRSDCVIRHLKRKHGFTREAAIEATWRARLAMHGALEALA